MAVTQYQLSFPMTLHLKFWDKSFSLRLELFNSDSLTVRLPGIRVSLHPSPTSQCQNYRQMPPRLSFRQALKIQTQIFLLAVSPSPGHKLNVKTAYSCCTKEPNSGEAGISRNPVHIQIRSKNATHQFSGTWINSSCRENPHIMGVSLSHKVSQVTFEIIFWG